jgi:hypoxanthine phosphoribosyltransferase
MSEVKKVYISWSEVHNIVEEFVNKFSLLKKDVEIFGIARGGWIPAQLVAYKLDVPRVYSIGLSTYKDDIINGNFCKPIMYQGVAGNFIKKHILLIDDIADTGKSFEHVIKYIDTFVGCEFITTFTLFSKTRSSVMPVYYGRVVADDEWIVFPWDRTKD